MRAEVADPELLCPSCACRPQEDERTGFCRVCADRRRVERYHAGKRPELEARRARWRERTAAARQAWRERQHAHRLLEAVRPRVVPAWAASADPLELGAEALRLLERLRPSATSEAHDDWAEACELVRLLAWGPGDGKEARR